MSPRPIIGYTTRNGIMNPLHWLTAVGIFCAGGRPIRLKPIKPRLDSHIDGLIIGGGTDLYPAHYKGDPKPDYIYDQSRDAMEIKWLNIAEDHKLPVLGICRGAQLMNVIRGGTLHIDVSKIYKRANYPSGLLANIFFRKDISVVIASKLYTVLNTNETRVNSMHKQAIDKVGKGLKISAKEENGVVQAIEDKTKPFFVGVQFHPEALIYDQRFRNIFKRLVSASRPKNPNIPKDA